MKRTSVLVENIRLKDIQSPADLKDKSIKELEFLAKKIREYLIANVSETGGHIAPNLGVVELTLALHKVYDSPKDKIIWDVGHQTYVHKMLTGRLEKFNTLRKMGGMSGFPKRTESEHDIFNTGHSSTSISAALGMAKARDLLGQKYSVVAVIGDGALTGGMAMEALNDAGNGKTDITVIINDNEMSISKNVGGMSRYLSRIRTEPIYFKVKEDFESIVNKIPAIGKSARKALDKVKGSIKCLLLPGMIFEEWGFKYFGPIDGHNIEEMVNVFNRAKSIKGPVILHVCTKKGKGYLHAEKTPHKYHGIAPFDIKSGLVKKNGNGSFSKVFGRKMVDIGTKNKKVLAITAAMPEGTGLNLFCEHFPDRFFDVGIAEQHAVTFAAGLAVSGFIPVVSIYSSFYQRAYDQLLHDVGLQNLHVVFAIDRAGIVGEDGETHQGIYDISFFSTIPNMTILAPADYNELESMLDYAINKINGPVAIRYPRGSGERQPYLKEPIEMGRAFCIREGKDVSVIAVGNMLSTALKAAEILREESIECEVINPRFIKPLDDKLLVSSARKTKKFFTIEDNIKIGGFSSSILALLASKHLNIPVKVLGFPDIPIEHGTKAQLYKKYGFDVYSIVSKIREFVLNGYGDKDD